MGHLLPDSSKWRLAASGKSFAIWESTKLQTKAQYHEENVNKQNVDDTSKRKINYVHPSHPIKLSGKMSCSTVTRIVNEVPELVENPDDNDHRLHDCSIDYPEEVS